MPVMRDERPRLLLLLAAAANRLPADHAWAVVIATLGIATLAEFGLGQNAGMSLFYAAAIVFAAWRLGRRAGFVVVAAVIAIIGAAHLRHAMVAGWPIVSPAAVWTLATNATGAVMLAILAAALRATIDHERMRAATDPLTGTLNRGAFFARLADARTAPDRERLLLACVDLDGFKAVNDQHGHAAGDRLLAGFASGVAAVLADGETIARIGGDEFAMLVRLAPGEDIGQRVRRLHRHLGEVLAAGERAVTCSIGVVPLAGARTRDDGTLLAAADAALYEVKRAGRDGVRLAGDGPHADDALAPAPLRLVAVDAS